MKMNYPLANRGDRLKRRRRSLKLGLTLFAAFLILITGGFGLHWLYRPVANISEPFWRAGSYFLDTPLFTFFENTAKLSQENRQLKIENQNLRLALAALQGVEKDNSTLRAILGRLDKKEKPVLGEVIFLPGMTPYDTLTLDVGSSNTVRSLKVGDLVVYDDTVLLGKIVSLTGNRSKVELLSSFGQEIPVNIGENNIPALADGKGSGNFEITLPKGTVVNPGDKIISPLYQGYLIGVVGAINRDSANPFQTILFKTPVNLLELKWVEIYGG